jgi:hypothetical protein
MHQVAEMQKHSICQFKCFHFRPPEALVWTTHLPICVGCGHPQGLQRPEFDHFAPSFSSGRFVRINGDPVLTLRQSSGACQLQGSLGGVQFIHSLGDFSKKMWKLLSFLWLVTPILCAVPPHSNDIQSFLKNIDHTNPEDDPELDMTTVSVFNIFYKFKSIKNN